MISNRKKIGYTAVIITALAALISGISLVGREARLVDVLTLFFSGFAGGASLVSALRPKSRKTT